MQTADRVVTETVSAEDDIFTVDACNRWSPCCCRPLVHPDYFRLGIRVVDGFRSSDLARRVVDAGGCIRAISAAYSDRKLRAGRLCGWPLAGKVDASGTRRFCRISRWHARRIGLGPCGVDHGLVAALASTAVGSKSAPAAAVPAANTGESLFPYDLDKLFRTERRPEGDPAYSRSEAARILLAATGRTEITAEDKAYLARLVANRTGVAQPDAERRVNEAIQNATIAVRKARKSAVVLAFSLAVSLLAGAAIAWYGATLGDAAGTKRPSRNRRPASLQPN